VQRTRRQAGVPRRAVRGRPGTVEVLRRSDVAQGGGQRSHDVGGVQVVGTQLAGHVLVTVARVQAPELRTRPTDSVRRLGLARLRQGVGVRVRHKRVSCYVQITAGRAGEPATLGAAEQHVHVQVPRAAERPGVDVLRKLRAPEHQQLPHVQTVPDPAPDMGRCRHAVGRPLRHAQTVRARCHVVERDPLEAAVHVGRELPIQVTRRHTAGALRARHRAGTVQLQAALRVRGQQHVRPRERRRDVRHRL